MPPSYVKVRFRLLYRPRFQKEHPAVIGSIPDLGNWRVDPSLNLHQRARCLPVVSGSEKGADGQKVWEAVICVPAGTECQWSWVILTPNGKLQTKETVTRNLAAGKNCVIVHSEWNVLDEVMIENTCRIDLRTKFVTLPGKAVGVCGSTDVLGNWDTKKCIVMDSCYPKASGKWRASFSVSNEIETEWKLVIIDKETKEVVRWEERGNRALTVCSQWVKMEAKWGQGEQVMDTMSLDFDETFNTKKILDAHRQAVGQDADAAASSEMPAVQAPEILSASNAVDQASAQAPGMLSASSPWGQASAKAPEVISAPNIGDQASVQAPVISDYAVSKASVGSEWPFGGTSDASSDVSANPIAVDQPSEGGYFPKSMNHRATQTSFNMDNKKSELELRNQPISVKREDDSSGDITQIRDMKPKATPNEVKVSHTSTATKRRFLISPSQRSTSMRNQTPCQVLLNAKSEVVSCVMLDDITESSGDMVMQNGDGESPVKCDLFDSRVESFHDPYINDSDDIGVNPHGVPDGEMKSTFFSFERRNQAVQILGHHRKYTFFPAFLIFLKIIKDYFWNTK